MLTNVEEMDRQAKTRRIRELETEVERLRAAYLSHLQMENTCKRTGIPCREPEKCGCYLEFQVLLNQQLGKET